MRHHSNSKTRALSLLLAASMFGLSGHATAGVDGNAVLGGALGGAAGAAIGSNVGGRNGAILGGAIGGGAGAAIGSNQSRDRVVVQERVVERDGHYHDGRYFNADHHHDNGKHRGHHKNKKHRRNHHDD